MKFAKPVPEPTIKRLAVYYRLLKKLSIQDEVKMICSKEIGNRLGITPTQIRKDISYFGEFGKKGIGYNVEELAYNIGKILGINKKRRAVLVGAGNLGRALVNYNNFDKIGITITHVFDIDLNKIGNKVGLITVQNSKKMPEVIKENEINIGIITVPHKSAQEVTDQLVNEGIKGIWNFAPVRLVVPGEVYVRDEDLSVGITSLIHYLNFNT